MVKAVRVKKTKSTKLEFLPPGQAFLGLEKKDAVSPDKAKAIVIPFGLEASVSYGGGTSRGPQAMIDASHEVELFDDELWCEAFRKYGIATLKPVKIEKSIPKALDQLAALTGAVLDMGKFPITFGGEHSITPGAIRPFVERWPDLMLLHFDAHADLRDGFEGEKFSHAAAIRRCLDNPGVSVVSLGIRNISQSEIPFLEANSHRIKIYWGRDKAKWNVNEIAKRFKGKTVYITFDVDGLDGSVMPATGTPEPGGVLWNDAMEIIRAVTKVAKRIVGADVNELAPIKGYHAADFLAAKLAYKILNYSLIK